MLKKQKNEPKLLYLPKIRKKPQEFRKLSEKDWTKISLLSLSEDLESFITPFFVIYEFVSTEYILDCLIDLCKKKDVYYSKAEYSFLNSQSSLIKNRIEIRGHSIKNFFHSVIPIFQKQYLSKIKTDQIYRSNKIQRNIYILTLIKNKRVLGFISENGITPNNLNGQTIAKDEDLCRTIRNHIDAMITSYSFGCFYAYWEYMQHKKRSGVYLKYLRISFAAPIDADNAKKELLGLSLLDDVNIKGMKKDKMLRNEGDLELITDEMMFEMFNDTPQPSDDISQYESRDTLMPNDMFEESSPRNSTENTDFELNMNLLDDNYINPKRKKLKKSTEEEEEEGNDYDETSDDDETSDNEIEIKKEDNVVGKSEKEDIHDVFTWEYDWKKYANYKHDCTKLSTDIMVVFIDRKRKKFKFNIDDKIEVLYGVIKCYTQCEKFVLKKYPGKSYRDRKTLRNLNSSVGEENLGRCLIYQEAIN